MTFEHIQIDTLARKVWHDNGGTEANWTNVRKMIWKNVQALGLKTVQMMYEQGKFTKEG